MLNTVTQGIHPSDNFMSRNDGERSVVKFAIDNVKVGAANTTGCDPYAYLARTGNTIRQDHGLQRRTWPSEDHCLHHHSMPS
jgi:hypothetical protein